MLGNPADSGESKGLLLRLLLSRPKAAYLQADALGAGAEQPYKRSKGITPAYGFVLPCQRQLQD